MPISAYKPQVAPVGPSGGGMTSLLSGPVAIPDTRPDTQVLQAASRLGQGLAQFSGVLVDAEVRLKQERDALDVVQHTNDYAALLRQDLMAKRTLKGKDAEGMTQSAAKDAEDARQAIAQTITDPTVRAEFLVRSASESDSYLDHVSNYEAQAHADRVEEVSAGSRATAEDKARAAARVGDFAAFQAAVAEDANNYVSLHVGSDNTAALLGRRKELSTAFLAEQVGSNPAAVPATIGLLRGVVDGEVLKRAEEAARVANDRQKVDASYSKAVQAGSWEDARKAVEADETLDATQKTQTLEMVDARFRTDEALQEKAKREAEDDFEVEAAILLSRGKLTIPWIRSSGMDEKRQADWILALDQHTRTLAAQARQERREQETARRMAASLAREEEARRRQTAADNAEKELYDLYSSGRLTKGDVDKRRGLLSPGRYVEWQEHIKGITLSVPSAPGTDWRSDPVKAGAALRGETVVDVGGYLAAGIISGAITRPEEINRYVGRGLSQKDAVAFNEDLMKRRRGEETPDDKAARDQGLALLRGVYSKRPSAQAWVIFTWTQATRGLHGKDITDAAAAYAADGGAAGISYARMAGGGKDSDLSLSERFDKIDPDLAWQAGNVVNAERTRAGKRRLSGDELKEAVIQFLLVPQNQARLRGGR